MNQQSSDRIGRKILVTGANGQLGQSFLKIRSQWAAYDFYFYTSSDLDITDYTSLEKAVVDLNPAVIINCAAYTAVDLAEEEPNSAYLVNETAVSNLAKLCCEHSILLVHYSSDYVYHSDEGVLLNEDAPKTPQGVYAKSKRKGEEEIIRSSCKSIILRTSWVYSEYGKNFVKTMLHLAKRGVKLSIISDQVGAPTYAPDIADSTMKMIDQVEKEEVILDAPLVINYAGEGQTNWYEFAKYIFEYAGIEYTISETTTLDYGAKAPRPAWSMLEMTKLKSIFGIAPKYWKESVGVCISELLKEEEL